jgi:hypothetical protein
MAAGVARRHVFGLYMDHFLLGVPSQNLRCDIFSDRLWINNMLLNLDALLEIL